MAEIYRPVCDHCGGSGILNVEAVEVHSFGDTETTIWQEEATWCHGCANGLLWKDLLNG